jgi:phosphatidylserine/phosphatidylglycerophosphate/cardiolipin synthase-like enzyme
VRDLVAFAVLLTDLLGNDGAALAWVKDFQVSGINALIKLGLQGDAAVVIREKAQAVGLLDRDGHPDAVRASELTIVLDILSAVPRATTPPREPEPLVFTVPHQVGSLISPSHRLDLLVNDVIARSKATLHIGGPFWNEHGWALLRPVIIPALEDRNVLTTFYLHPQESGHLDVVNNMLADARNHGSVRALWWCGGHPSLMHAKFVVADAGRGYLGSANLTSLGMAEHLEVGVALRPEQSKALLQLLEALEASGLFTSEEP